MKSTPNLRHFESASKRRTKLSKKLGIDFTHTAHFSFNESYVGTHNCENLLGVTQVPLGVAGPLKVSNIKYQVSSNYYIPLATTEGALVASINRGCKAITESGGAITNSHRIGATRGPVFYTGGVVKNQELFTWIKTHQAEIKKAAELTSSHLHFKKSLVKTAGPYAFVRFSFDSEDAMGMNMVSIATQKIVELIEKEVGIKCLSLAGNFDTDKKVSWLNFIENRGIKVWAEVVLSEKIVKQVLKTAPQALFQTWLAKCVHGSIMSGAVGSNAQMANVIAAIFLATGQDLGHVGEASMGITTVELRKNTVYISVYVPDLMVGTVGGGTGLATQHEALQLLDVAGGNEGKNAVRLAEIIGATCLAGEISLLASLSEGSLVKAHERLGKGGK